MGRLVVIEGLDGAGKRTLADRLEGALDAEVARFAFPRYAEDVHAELVRDALYGRMGDLAASVHGMAVLFALDRGMPPPRCAPRSPTHDVVLVDRYVASNAAYGAARLHEDAAGELVAWVRALEIERFGIPVPDHQLTLTCRGRWRRRGPPTASGPRPTAPRRLRVRRRAAGAHGRRVRAARRDGLALPVDGARRRAGHAGPRCADPPVNRVSESP